MNARIECDPFDPRYWSDETEPKRIWLDDKALRFCVVDEADYQWALQWKWTAIPDKHGNKFYAARMAFIEGRHVRLYLHKEILRRAGKKRPSRNHTIGDHRDGDSLNNRRRNLRWATPRMNRLNIGGMVARQYSLAGLGDD